MNDEVKFSASNDDEDYEANIATLQRINTVTSLLKENGSISTAITGLHNQDGKLIVSWARQPSFGDTEFLRELWREVSDKEVIHQFAE